MQPSPAFQAQQLQASRRLSGEKAKAVHFTLAGGLASSSPRLRSHRRGRSVLRAARNRLSGEKIGASTCPS
jgi:hypothetical protein